MKVREISTIAEVDHLEKAIVSSAEATANAIRSMLARASGIQVLAQREFQKAGRDPLSERPLNVIEQINQTFTYLASCEALRYLLVTRTSCRSSSTSAPRPARTSPRATEC